MLFNSHIFIFAFLPITLLGFFFLARRYGQDAAKYWLLLASLVFYGWWSLPYVALLVGWIIANYVFGEHIIRVREREGPGKSRPWAILSIVLNLAGLAYYKYAVFFAGSLSALTGVEFAIGAVILPLAISFHTFQQIAYIADVQGGQNPRYSLFDYALFVSYFPQLIAGPIVHHHELLPQFKDNATYKPDSTHFSTGIAFFVMGLVKKLAIADPLSGLASPVFASAAATQPGLVEAWIAIVAFSFGLYFDFSAYSDMAVGLARMMGIKLPYNFDSPYKATSIIDFWRRWHMTLSRFLRDYVYIPIGGNRLGPARRSTNLMVTMLAGGLWHGASWTFVVWGGLHGLFLLINHAFNSWSRWPAGPGRPIQLGSFASRILTLLAVSFAWTFFASPDFASAMAMVKGMLGGGGLIRSETAAAIAESPIGVGILNFEASQGWLAVIEAAPAYLALLVGAIVALFAPNSQEFIDGDGSRAMRRFSFSANRRSAIVCAAGFLLALTLLADVKEFVYFQF